MLGAQKVAQHIPRRTPHTPGDAEPFSFRFFAEHGRHVWIDNFNCRTPYLLFFHCLVGIPDERPRDRGTEQKLTWLPCPLSPYRNSKSRDCPHAAKPMPQTDKASTRPHLTPEQVFHDYAPRVYNLARRMLGNDADAEDVTQDVLLQVVRKLDTFRGDADFATWLHRVTVNLALAHRGKRARRQEHEVHDPLMQFEADGHHAGPVRPWSLAAERQALDRERQQLIEKAIAQLPEMYRDVYVLADVEGMGNPEIADILGLSVAAVKSRLHRARLMMRHALAPHFEEALAS
jgi:RNA polymerase sigma-70 factor (ECF subfamily)